MSRFKGGLSCISAAVSSFEFALRQTCSGNPSTYLEVFNSPTFSRDIPWQRREQRWLICGEITPGPRFVVLIDLAAGFLGAQTVWSSASAPTCQVRGGRRYLLTFPTLSHLPVRGERGRWFVPRRGLFGFHCCGWLQLHYNLCSACPAGHGPTFKKCQYLCL